MTPHEQLQAIQERAEAGTLTGLHNDDQIGIYGRLSYAIGSVTDDVPRLVAALRAVLDFTVADNTPIWVGIALDEIISEALGGGA